MAARDTRDATVPFDAATGPLPSSRSSVLLATASEERRESLRGALERAGFDVCEAITGEGAIWSVCREHPAALVMDCSLPGVTGLRAAEVLKDEPALRDIPILLLGCAGDPEEGERARDAGCDAFLPAAEDEAEVLEAVCRLTEPIPSWVDRMRSSR